MFNRKYVRNIEKLINFEVIDIIAERNLLVRKAKETTLGVE